MSTWADVKKGDRVVLKGQAYTVAKVKVAGKRATVKVVGVAGEFKADVKLKDAVKMAPAKRGRKADHEGEWYKPSKAERKAAKLAERQRQALPAGDPTVTEPPAKLSGDPWESRRDKVEAKLDKLLGGAVLVGESSDESQGYYVPPVDVDTVAAHWMIFHHGDDWQDVGGAELLQRHAAEHNLTAELAPLKVNHWHTDTRPKA